jgi:hypothetical protein
MVRGVGFEPTQAYANGALGLMWLSLCLLNASTESCYFSFHLYMSFAQIMPEITAASIPPPGKVEAPTRYRPFIGVLK